MSQTFRSRLREITSASGCVDFYVTAETPEEAAQILSTAYEAARASNTSVVTLPDGQVGIIDPESPEVVGVSYHLLDGADAEIATIAPAAPKPN